MTPHPSPTTLERFSVGDLAGPRLEETAAHVEGCSSCRAFLEELGAARERRLSAVPPERFVGLVAERRDRGAQLARYRQRRLLLGAGSGLAVAAAAVLLMVRPGPQVRLKGSGVVVQRSRAGEVRILGEGDGIRAHDSLRLVVTLPRPSPVAAWFVDANGRVDDLVPGPASSLPAGEQPLPGSAEVEAPCVDLKVVVAIGAAAHRDTEAALRRAVSGGVPRGEGWLPEGTILRSLPCER